MERKLVNRNGVCNRKVNYVEGKGEDFRRRGFESIFIEKLYRRRMRREKEREKDTGN